MNAEQEALQHVQRIPDDDWARRLTAALLPDRASEGDSDVVRQVDNRPVWRATRYGWAFSRSER